MAKLLSVNVGLPRNVTWNGRAVFTSVWKSPVQGRRKVRRLNIEGDAQGDLEGHGGENRAVYVYQTDSYRYWERILGRNNFVFGQFGENFTVDGLSDQEVFIGDRYRIGSAIFEVSQPRVTCFRLGIRMNDPRMAALLVAHHRPGFYFRVLQEGEVGEGDEIVKISEGAEHMSVAEIDGLLYLPGHSSDRLARALKISALSKGWRDSFQAILQAEADSKSPGGNPGLAFEEKPPAWAGFRQMLIKQIRKESDTVKSFVLTPVDENRLPLFEAGQFVVIRLVLDRSKPAILRSYSLSDLPAFDHFRISVKSELNGLGSSFLCNQVREGDVLEVSAPRGSFTLRDSEVPLVLLSAGVGATPVVSMLHALSAQASTREIWWIYGARNSSEHPFAEESRALLKLLSNARPYIVYSKPEAGDKAGTDFDAVGHIDAELLKRIGVHSSSEFYLCGPPLFLQNLRDGLQGWGVDSSNVHTELFGSIESVTPGIEKTLHSPHIPEGEPGSGPMISFARSGISTPWNQRFASLLELAEACDVPVRWSCRTGVCHTCTTGLISGTISYSPEPLEEPGTGNVLVCCAQPKTDCTLDL